MSYNANTIAILSQSDFRLPLEALEELRSMLKGETPELCLLDQPYGMGFGRMSADDRNGFRYFNHVTWCGEGSGHTWEMFAQQVLPRTLGSVDLVVTWEGGDSHSGLRVRDGVVTRHKVVFALGEPT